MNDSAGRRQRLRRLRRPAWLGTVRRTSPLSDHFGRERGTPVDRYYIERFLQENRERIRGRVLEVKDSDYTRRFGVDVSRSDVLDIDDRNPDATVVADLVVAGGVEAAAFDCFILTQTLHYIFDVGAALEHVHRILRPGGTVLCTVPVVSRIGRGELRRSTGASRPPHARSCSSAHSEEVRSRYAAAATCWRASRSCWGWLPRN